MSELFGKNVQGHIDKTNVLKDEFGWEVPYELIPIPSNGMIYDPDTKMYNLDKVKIKAMTAKEEDILASQALLKEGTVITHLLKACIMEEGVYPEHMISGDRNALMIAIRITGYGSEYSYQSTCQNCGHVNKKTAMLDSLPIKRLEIEPIEPGRNEFEYTLPVTKKKVTFKFLTDKDDKDREASEKFIKKHTESKVQNKVTSFLEYSIVSVDGIKDKNKIKHFVMNMPAFDSRKLRRYISDNEPGIDMKQDYEFDECGTHNEVNLPVTSEFFWPST